MELLIVAMMAGAAVPPPADYRFEISRADGTLYDPWTLSDDKVELRSFLGSGAKPGDFVAPVIRVAPGQRLNVLIDNKLEACSEQQRKANNCYNDTNLHTHGLWVSPSGNSDNVLVSVAPGERFQYAYDIPADHPAGTFWYHPHRHGNGFVQVGSGMAGALIVTGNRLPTMTSPGDIDVLLKDRRGRPLPERIILFQLMPYGCLNAKGLNEGERNKEGEPIRPFICAPGKIGRIESFDNDWGWRQTGRFTGINGKVQPVLSAARTGGFERWRLVNAGTGESMRMRLYRLDPAAPPLRSVKAQAQVAWRQQHCIGQPLPMWQIAMDGLTRSAVRKVDEAVLFAGERTDVLVQLPQAGTYCMVNDTSRIDAEKDNPSRMVALIAANGAAAANPDPDQLLRSMLVGSAERALAGNDRRAVRDRVVGELGDGLKLSSFTWHKPIPKEEVSGYREVILNIVGGPDETAFRVNGRTYDHDRFDAILPLGKAEEWRTTSLTLGHPLHIHVNPFEIVSIKDHQGRDLTDPKGPVFDPDYGGLNGQWKDTVFIKENVRIAFRTRYERFTGDFVIHCHIMFHGDHGMMQNLRIAAEGEAAPAHKVH
ncbi:MAG TPA: multicopper oxidase domain-containing protein [Sphingomicrobium sp.]|nr:multicopper oxidase domain-containing protein [Sphingomicrobium sp.]